MGKNYKYNILDQSFANRISNISHRYVQWTTTDNLHQIIELPFHLNNNKHLLTLQVEALKTNLSFVNAKLVNLEKLGLNSLS